MTNPAGGDASILRIGVVDDHQLFRETLIWVLEDVAGVQVTAQAESGRELFDALEENVVDLLLVDLSLPDTTGFAIVTEMARIRPMVRCLVLSGHADRTYAARALDAGAVGYVVKGRPEELLDAIEAVRRGESFISEAVRPRP